jgi:hypothetical protein
VHNVVVDYGLSVGVSVRSETRSTVGGLLSGLAGLMVVGAAFVVMGEDFPTHVGLTRTEQGVLAVRIALCPGEQVRSVQVSAGSEPGQTWRVSGPGASIEPWPIGVTPPGFSQDESPNDVAFVAGSVAVRVTTSKVRRWGDSFDVGSISAQSVMFDGKPLGSAEFDDVALHRYPCSDPNGGQRRLRLAIYIVLLAVIPGSIAALLLRSREAGPATQ